jgi:hypothetical protein
MKINASEQILDLVDQLPIDQLPDLLTEIADRYCMHHTEIFLLGKGTPSMYMHNFLLILFNMKPGTRAAQCIAFSCAAMAMAVDTIEGQNDKGYAPAPKLKRALPQLKRLNQQLGQLVDPKHL